MSTGGDARVSWLLCWLPLTVDPLLHRYELNPVLNDGSRINVVDHGNLERLRGDAITLSQFLDKPVWDATRG